MLALASSLAYRIWGQRLLAATMVPATSFTAMPTLKATDYDRAEMWLARPDRTQRNPSLWLPKDYADPVAPHPAAVFFLHPTSYDAIGARAQWNMALGDQDAEARAGAFLRMQATALAGAGPVWAPRYRQAHLGAFFTDKPDARKALDLAYGDVSAAFTAFLQANPTGPIILAGHSQGSLHLMRLMHEQVAGKPVAARIAAAYVVGWPVSIEADIPALGLPACTRRGQSGCILSWQTFAEPADPTPIEMQFKAGTGLTGKSRQGTHMLCVNPLTGAPASAAAASTNLGTLADLPNGGLQLVQHAVPARCAKSGFLLIGDAPTVGAYVLPGNNYHVYDYALFWANIRRDAKERLAAFLKP